MWPPSLPRKASPARRMRNPSGTLPAPRRPSEPSLERDPKHGTFVAAERTLEEEIIPMFTFLLWCILFVLCWPLALIALIAYPFIWLILLPFRLLGIAVHGALALVAAVIMLPARLLSAPFRA